MRLKPSGNCLPVHQGLSQYPVLTDPRSIPRRFTGATPNLARMDQGSVAIERGALREDLLAVLTGPTSAMNIAQPVAVANRI